MDNSLQRGVEISQTMFNFRTHIETFASKQGPGFINSTVHTSIVSVHGLGFCVLQEHEDKKLHAVIDMERMLPHGIKQIIVQMIWN